MHGCWDRAVESALPDVLAWRHELHRHPELSFDLEKTSALVASVLAGLPVAVRRFAGTGCAATITGAAPGPTVAFRCDMDALPICEAGESDHRSRHEGKMHACGHDGHTAILLGLARALCGLRDELRGRVVLVFQPAEEDGGGGRVMVEEGVLRDPRPDAVFALHGTPGIDAGSIGVKAGVLMASTHTFDVVVAGRGGHGARPQDTVDPILVAARIVDGLQAAVSRERDPLEPVVVSVCSIHGGTAFNVIPDECRLLGTIRTLTVESTRHTVESVKRLAEGIASAHRATARVTVRDGYPPTVNDAACTEYVARVGADVLGAGKVVRLERPYMGGEDFSYFLNEVPGALFRLGLGPGSAPLHNPRFDFNDAALRHGLRMLVHLALRFAAEAPAPGA